MTTPTNLINIRNQMHKVFAEASGSKPNWKAIDAKNNTAGKLIAMAALDLKASLAMGLEPDYKYMGIDPKTRKVLNPGSKPVLLGDGR